MEVVTDINTVSDFISQPDITSLSSIETVDCIILCVCSVLYSAETVFEILCERPQLTKTLVLCGGIGHSTEFIHNAVAEHPRFKQIAIEIAGLPEAEVLLAIWEHFFAIRVAEKAAPLVLVEARSTTCATNAVEARKLLEANGITSLESVVIIQDPTMIRRTVACFQHVYFDMAKPPRFAGCPIFLPRVRTNVEGQLIYDTPPVPQEAMWKIDRFLELVMGEVPRLRDDENGYGPNGKNTIVHVDIPVEVEKAYARLVGNITHRRFKTR